MRIEGRTIRAHLLAVNRGAIVTVALPSESPKTDLTLSVRPEQQHDHAEGLAERRELFLRLGGCPHCWPADPYSERDPAIITESELRLLDGNR